MILVSWLSSWWLVPAIREVGTKAGGSYFGLWAVSVPLGGLLVVTGAALVSGVEKLRIWIMVGFGALFFVWFVFANPAHVLSPLFGIGGGIITAAFLGIVWTWSRNRKALSRSGKLGADLQIAGYFFMLVAAWYLCGLLGAPEFTLRPDLPTTGAGSSGAVNLATTILLCLSLGWALVLVGHRSAGGQNS
jgi:hypothetical protein